MVALACVLLTVALAGYVFYPDRTVAAQREKSRLEYLQERKAAVEDNLRDLHFEHRAGKYRDEEFGSERAVLEAEAAQVAAEIDALDGTAAGKAR